MLKSWFAALLLFASVAPAGAAPEMFLRERCHQGECTFTQIIQTKTIGKNAGGYMLEVKARSASLRVPRKADDPYTMKPPKNYGLVRVLYVYCSKEKPALIFYDNAKFYAHLLKIGAPAAGYEIDSHIEYWAACHDKIVSVADVAEGKLAKEAADLGYGNFPEGWGQQRDFDFRTKKKAFRFFGL
jgi:hypothetical protein